MTVEKGPEPFRISYYLYLAILLWASIPEASVATSFQLLLSCLILLCGCVFFLEAAYTKVDLTVWFRRFALPLVLLLLLVLWVFIQTFVFDLAFIEAIAPTVATYYRTLGLDEASLSVARGNTQLRALFTLALFVFFILSIVLNQSAARMRRTLMLIVICGTGQALYGSFMTLSGLEYGFLIEKTSFRGVATGTFLARNHFAAYLEMCLACGIGLLLANLERQERQHWRERVRAVLDTILGPKMRLRIYLALMVIALVLSRSRMGNTAFFTALLICGFLYLFLQRKFNWGAILLLASLLLVDMLIVSQWFGFEQLVERLESTSAESETRDEAVKDTLAMFQANPLAGYGFGAYYAAYSAFQEEAPIYYDHAHNDYLEFAVDLGLIGFVPLGLLVLASAWMAVSALYTRHNRLGRAAGFAASMGILALMIHSAVDFNLQIPANALMLVFLLALGWMARHHTWQAARSGY